MTSKEAIEKIKKLLFGQEQFGLYKTKDGIEMQCEGDMALEKEIYIITPDGNIPAEEGEYEMEDGMKVKVKDGMVSSINYAEEEIVEEEVMEDEVEVKVEEEETTMVSAELIDGTIVESDTEVLSAGDTLFVVTEEGRSPAPTGDHETTDGNIVVVEDGIIKEIKQKDIVEEEMTTEEEASFDELLEVFTAAFNHLTNDLNVMKQEYDKLREDFNKFSAEPAGERQYFQQDYKAMLKDQKSNKLHQLAQLRRK
jgi:hypothetical protein